MGLISVAIRSGLCVGAVKWTVDQGVWGDAGKAIEFKERTCKAVNGNQHVQTGKAHFQTYVPMPEVMKDVINAAEKSLTFIFSSQNFLGHLKLDLL